MGEIGDFVPSKSGARPVLVVGSVLVALLVAGGGAVAAVALRGGGDDRPTVGVSTPPLFDPSKNITSMPPDIDLSVSVKPRRVSADVLKATIKTRFGTIFHRVGTVSGRCADFAPERLRKTLKAEPCVGDAKGALYTGPKKAAVVSLIIMPMKSAASARAVADGGFPYLIRPGEGTGVRRYRGGAFKDHFVTSGNFVVFATAYRSDLAQWDKDFAAENAASQLSTEIANVLAS